MIAHRLRGEGFDASEDDTGRGVPVVPAQPYTLAIRGRADNYDLEFRQDGLANALLTPNGGRAGINVGAVAHAFDARQSDVVQYGDLTGPLDTDGHSVGVMQPVAIQGNLIGRTEGGPSGIGVSDEGVMFTLTKTDVHGIALLGGIDYENNAHAADEPTGQLLKGSPTGGGRPLPAVAIRTANTGANGHGVALEVAHTLDQAQGQAVAFAQNQIGEVRCGDVVNTLNTNSNASGRNTPMAQTGMAVRRLTPRECERLQGFPDDYTLIAYRNKPAADGPRYKALGNSMAVPVMRWIGQRLQAVEGMTE